MMNKKEIFRKVGGIINELNEQYEYLSQSPDNLNELELELFAANSDFLKDHIAILVKLNESSKTRNSYAAENIKENDMKGDDTKVQDISEPVLESLEMEKEVEEIEEIKKEEPVEISEEPVVKEVVISERTIALPLDKKSGVEPENPPLTINDMLSARSGQGGTVSGQFNNRQAKDLKGMISLNDKLLFVRDLFNGYSLAYSEAIELLNRFDRIEAADNFLKQNYSVKNNWSDKQAVSDKFYEILDRRFAK